MFLCFNEADLLFCQTVQDTNLENTEDSSPTCEVIVDLKKTCSNLSDTKVEYSEICRSVSYFNGAQYDMRLSH